MMKAKSLFAILLLFITASGPAVSEAPPYGQLGLSSVTYKGTGCPAGSAASSLSPDGQTMTLIFSQFGVDTSVRNGWPMRKACNVELMLRSLPGWQYSLISVDIRGYANLQDGVVGVQKIAYTFGRNNKRSVDRLRIVGPYDNNFANHSEVSANDSEWSPCGRAAPLGRLLLRLAVNIRPQRGFGDDDGDSDTSRRDVVFPSGYMAVDSADGGIVHRYQLAWRRCG